MAPVQEQPRPIRPKNSCPEPVLNHPMRRLTFATFCLFLVYGFHGEDESVNTLIFETMGHSTWCGKLRDKYTEVSSGGLIFALHTF
ncbi:hypothetical protein K402DRAFT_183964 [Aulographum hederae CBS 113979]|uniref:Uncharacterized protein n=1 Tax=Aulographum hederae CBS 113979 TaxID=1176131 RepID=A0A6G1GQ90_9PEZI|nr:hypothetical protein K402DRAFT_183964 [Aulographum hederae CBS 113979]